MNALFSYFGDFLHLFFPELCAGCSTSLVKNESVICTSCLYHLPYTHFHKDRENPVIRQMTGRLPLVFADAFLYFNKGSRVQNLIHELKYNNRPEVGYRLGELYGLTLKEYGGWEVADIIIPVPLHQRKLRRRGYNQAEKIADGLSAATKVPAKTKILMRTSDTSSQTRKSRFERYENMKNAFSVSCPGEIEGKHILLVDDVITTGATIEGCAQAALSVPGTIVSIPAIAYAE